MRRKTLYGIIGAILLAAVFFVCAVGSSWFTNGDIKTWFNGWGQGKSEENKEQTNVIITEGGSHGVALMCAEIPVKDFAVYDLDEEEVESAFTLKLEVTPETAVVTNFTWSAEFVNVNSEWASGKEISDYYIITPAEDNKSAVAACKQAFGEPIRIKVVYDSDTTIFATKMADYVKKIVNGHLTGANTELDFDNGWGGGEYGINFTVEYGVGTVQGTTDINTLSVCTELSDEAYNYLLSEDSAAYPYMSHFISVNSGFELMHKSLAATFDPARDDWYDSCSTQSFCNISYPQIKDKQYLDMAFKVMLENTTNQIRCVGTVTYKYGDSYTETVTLYGDWGTVSPSNIVLVDSINIGGGGLIH